MNGFGSQRFSLMLVTGDWNGTMERRLGGTAFPEIHERTTPDTIPIIP
ncbi:MAG: hypothetical protein PHE53_10095 [Thermoguttaceae bacterium]|nr:hypothetical protein [Thermoguttaceae bacterium]